VRPTRPRDADRVAGAEPAPSRDASSKGAVGAVPGEGAATFGRGRPIPRPIFYGIAIAAVGGPLSLAAFNVPQALGDQMSSSGLLVLIGIAAFAFPVIVWRRYAEKIASPGGLFSFVRAATGERVAVVQGLIWTVSYFLYLPATVAYVVYEVLPVGFPRVSGFAIWLELGIPIVLVLAFAVSPLASLAGVAVLGVAQVVLVGVLAAAPVTRRLPPVNAFAPHGAAPHLALGAIAVSLFFVCASLPLFLGGEIAEARAVTRRALPMSVAVAGVCVLIAAVALARVPSALRSGPLPGSSVADALVGPGLASAIVLGTALSMLSLVLLEFVALTRLLPTMFRLPPGPTQAGLGALFVAGSAAFALDPIRLYDRTLPPMLVALWISQGLVFAVFPWFRRRLGLLRVSDVLVAVGATSLMLFGLYTTLHSGAAS
jgi:hypothetical protein